jgi:nucleoside-diphosphate-sugar epimerase
MSDQKHVLVSGGSGFVASHIVDLLIKQKYAVTATVRSPLKGEDILKLHPEWKDSISFAYIPDVAVEGAFDEVFRTAETPFTYIVHTASPVNFAVKDLKKDLVDPAVQGYGSLPHKSHKNPLMISAP